MTTRMEHVRQMPGRIVGRTVTSTASRVSHSRCRPRAAHPPQQGDFEHLHQQGLLVTAATIYMSLLAHAAWSRSPRPAWSGAPSWWMR